MTKNKKEELKKKFYKLPDIEKIIALNHILGQDLFQIKTLIAYSVFFVLAVIFVLPILILEAMPFKLFFTFSLMSVFYVFFSFIIVVFFFRKNKEYDKKIEEIINKK